LEEAFNNGYEEQEPERPIDFKKVYKIFSSKKVIKSALNVSDSKNEDEQKITTNPLAAIKMFNKYNQQT
jgi:hypothetical protein